MQKKIAVIDVGSNSVRLMFLADGKILYKHTVITRLGEGLALTGRLQPAAATRTMAQISAFVHSAKADGAQAVYAYATAAVRGASNGRDFAEAVQKDCTVRLEILSGEEEARIGLVGALGDKDGILLDIGGGSTELVVQCDRKVEYAKSIDVGVVRLKDLCGEDKEILTRFCDKKVQDFAGVKEGSESLPLYAVGGTATTLAAWSLRLTSYDGTIVTGSKFTLGQIKDLSDDLFLRSAEKIAASSCVDEKRAQVIKGGALWLYKIMDHIGAREVTISDNDNLDGYAKTRGLV